MVRAVVRRGFPHDDAEDAAQTVLEQIAKDPDRYAARLRDLDHHRGYFVMAALNAYLMQLRSERRRRLREDLHQFLTTGDVGTRTDETTPGSPYRQKALELIDASELTARQRQYMLAVLVEGMSIEQIAASTETTVDAVRRVLGRAVAVLRQLCLPSSAG